jgi:hypothetical protein
MAGKPPAKLQLISTGEGKKDKMNFGPVWRSKFPGVFTVRLALPHPTETKNGYPVDDDVVAIKTRSGAKYVIDPKKGFFINLNVFEALEARPPYNGGASAPAPVEQEEDAEDFGDDEF